MRCLLLVKNENAEQLSPGSIFWNATDLLNLSSIGMTVLTLSSMSAEWRQNDVVRILLHTIQIAWVWFDYCPISYVSHVFHRWSLVEGNYLISMESQWSKSSPKTGRGFRIFRPGQMIYLLPHTPKQVRNMYGILHKGTCRKGFHSHTGLLVLIPHCRCPSTHRATYVWCCCRCGISSLSFSVFFRNHMGVFESWPAVFWSNNSRASDIHSNPSESAFLGVHPHDQGWRLNKQ